VGTDYVITVLEVLSPTNKRPGRGRRLYEDKRMEVLTTRSHLVEIDLIRSGEPMPLIDNGRVSDYRILVSRGDRRPNAILYPFGVRQPIPAFPLPLKANDQEPMVDIGQLLHDLYDQASYDLRIDYTGDPDPPLLSVDAAWADRLLHQQGLRVGVFWPYHLPLEDKGFSLMWRLFSVDNPSRASGSACLLETRITPKSATHEQQ
jgi:hypothetical protein